MTSIITSERLLVALVLALGSGIIGILWWAVRKFFMPREEAEQERIKNRNEIKALADFTDTLGQRVGSLEKRVEALPTAHDITELKLGLAEIKGNQQAQQASLTGVERNMALVTQHLLEQK